MNRQRQIKRIQRYKQNGKNERNRQRKKDRRTQTEINRNGRKRELERKKHRQTTDTEKQTKLDATGQSEYINTPKRKNQYPNYVEYKHCTWTVTVSDCPELD